MSTDHTPRLGRTALALGLFAFLAVVFTLADPGITIDEPLDVRPGRTYVSTLLKQKAGFFQRETIDRVFADNAEHPPLGRWLLGVASTTFEPFAAAIGWTDPYAVIPARVAPAACFGLLITLVTLATGRLRGQVGGIAAGGALLFMPRAFAHAHLGALDTFIALFWVAALLAAERGSRSSKPTRAMAFAGLVLGLALLTKIHAWFLPPIVLGLLLVRFPWRHAVGAFGGWLVVGLGTFLLGWPWLWHDTLTRLGRYLGTGTERLSLQVQYFGQFYADRDVPWHYPWVYFAITVPVGLHLLGVLGAIEVVRGRRKSEGLPWLALAGIGLFLGLFSTRIPVYDGERLFLLVFPLWAILIGIGGAWAWGRTSRRWAHGLMAAAFLAQGYGVVALHPFGLSYYNALVGGLPGAQRLGLELTYWGDAVDRVLLDRLAAEAKPGDLAALAPTLHHIQGVASLTPALVRNQVTIVDQSRAAQADWLILYRRDAYLNPEWRALLNGPPPVGLVAERSKQGVVLSRVLRIRKP
ncbi:glycosyltransferase family 39 protein [Isosphaeraceae bacterium EP7]